MEGMYGRFVAVSTVLSPHVGVKHRPVLTWAIAEKLDKQPTSCVDQDVSPHLSVWLHKVFHLLGLVCCGLQATRNAASIADCERGLCAALNHRSGRCPQEYIMLRLAAPPRVAQKVTVEHQTTRI
jgi:hypothetical protein